jgi:hypothetical protein
MSLVSGRANGNGTSNSVTGVVQLEAWAPKATLAPGSPDITYQVADLVLYNAGLY